MQNRVAPRAKMSTAGDLENSDAASLFMKSSGDMKAEDGEENRRREEKVGREEEKKRRDEEARGRKVRRDRRGRGKVEWEGGEETRGCEGKGGDWLLTLSYKVQ